MTTAAQYAKRMRTGKCGTCGDKRAKGSIHYCQRCLIGHRERSRSTIRDKRQNDEAFRKAENEKQRARMRELRARRRGVVAVALASLRKSGYFKKIGRKRGQASAQSMDARARQIRAIRAARARWKRHRALQESTATQ